MSILEVTLNQLSRLVLHGQSRVCQTCARNFRTQGGPSAINISLPLSAEPLRKKVRISSQAVMLKEMKRKVRLEKSIKKLRTRAQIEKPIEEIHGDRLFLRTISERQREKPTISFEESERRAKLHKDWCRYKRTQHAQETHIINQAMQARERALSELRKVSEKLYIDALKIDSKLVPYSALGPVHTPPIPDYDCPDGEIVHTTRVYEGEQPHPPFPVIDHKTSKS